MIYLTSDCHRDFEYIKKFCDEHKTTKNDILFVTGDAQINYFENEEDHKIKKELSTLPITFIFIQGNKEKRPSRIAKYKLTKLDIGEFYIEDEFPNLMFAKDGQILNIYGKTYLILGGAYSVYAPGKQDGDLWWDDEQMSETDRKLALENLAKADFKVDYILSHTAPFSKIPNTGWISEIDKSKLDLNLEKFLDEIDSRTKYKKWFIGHYHINQIDNKYNYVFKELVAID